MSIKKIEAMDRGELEKKATWLIREADLSPGEWNNMVTDVLSPEYLADVVADAVINWDGETLRNFVVDWNHRLGE